MKENQYRVIRIFKILSNPVRYKILLKLENLKQISVVDLAKLLDKSLSVISRHLRVLKNLDLVKCHLEGKYSYYSLKNKKIIAIIKTLENIYKRK